ncbi:MAG: HNH endonuclease [Candidatus Poribacteria bacterium]|nr:HNH endonuclease [Candidatus Poribacteria bacterium]
MQDIRKSPEYQRWRREVRHRDENTCRICAVQRNLHVHHIKPLEKYTEFATDIDNGITLCGNCHTFFSGREENTNLQTITEAFTGQQDTRTAEQLKRLNDKFCVYLESLLKSEDRDIVSDAVYKMFVHLQIYPDSLDQFLHLIEYIFSSEKGFENQFARQIAIETLKNHPSKTASEILSKFETPCNYQDGKSAYLQGDYATALKKFEPLAESGHIESQHYLGVIYEKGRGVAKDTKTAIKWYLKAAQQGYTKAQRALGLMYTYGSERDDTKAIKWYTKAAEQGDVSAILDLVNNYGFADMYIRGRGVALDDTEAIKWCTKLLEMGYGSKQFYILLGDIYVRGRGVEQDSMKAIKWYTKAGTTQGIVRIGEMYEFGRGVARDYAEAIKWYTKAAERGSTETAVSLGDMYAKGRGVEKNDTEAVKWYTKAAERGRTDAMNSLGDMYDKGRGVAKDAKTSVKWYTKAAEQGDMDSQRYLGWIYNGNTLYPFIKQDHKEAVKWYTKAAEQGDCTAQWHLGDMYTKGRGVKKNEMEAAKWYLKAVQQGNEDARLDFERLYANRKTTRLKIDKDTLQEPYRPKYRNSIPFSQEPYWTRLSFFDSLSAAGIRLFLSELSELSELGYWDNYVKIEIKDKRFRLEVRGSEPLSQSGSLNSIFDEGLESEHSQPNSSEAYPPLKGEVFLTEEDIPTLRILLINILTR